MIDNWPPKIENVVDFEKDFKVGDKVLVTKPKGETTLWPEAMDRFDGKIMEILRSNGLHFWKLVDGFGLQFHESWLTKIDPQEINDMIKRDNDGMREIIKNLGPEHKDLGEKLSDITRRHSEILDKRKVNFLAMTPMNHIYRCMPWN